MLGLDLCRRHFMSENNCSVIRYTHTPGIDEMNHTGQIIELQSIVAIHRGVGKSAEEEVGSEQ